MIIVHLDYTHSIVFILIYTYIYVYIYMCVCVCVNVHLSSFTVSLSGTFSLKSGTSWECVKQFSHPKLDPAIVNGSTLGRLATYLMLLLVVLGIGIFDFNLQIE
jgi:hypothetical protein